MSRIRFNELSQPGSYDGLLATTALKSRSVFVSGGEDDFSLEGGMNEFAYNTRGAMNARKKKTDLILLMQNYLDNKDYGFDDYGLYPWNRHRYRNTGDADARKRRADLDEHRARSQDPDRARVATDEEGRRVIIDKEGRVAVDAEGRAIVIDGEKYRIADGGEGARVIVNAEGRILNGADGKPLYVNDTADFRIVANEDGVRTLVDAERKPITALNLESPDVRVSTGTDIGTHLIGKSLGVTPAAAAAETVRAPTADAPRVTTELDVPRAALAAVDTAPRIVAPVDADIRVVAPVPPALDARIVEPDTVRIPELPAEPARIVAEEPAALRPVEIEDAAPRIAATPDAPVRVADTPVELPRVLDAGEPIRVPETPEPSHIVVAEPPAELRAPVIDEPDVRLSPIDPVDLRAVGATPVELPRVLDAAEPIRIPETAPEVRAATPDYAPFRSFLAESGETLEGFQTRINNAINGPAVPRGTDIHIPGRALDIGHIRGGRLLRMATPNGFDLFIAGGVGTGVAIYEGMQAGVVDKLTGGSNVEAIASAAYEGSGAGLKAGAETLMFVGTGIALAEGRTAEGTVRAIEDTVEIASPFALGALGAYGGGAVGAGAGGVGAVPGAVLGFIGGVAAGLVVSMTASEATRAIARGLGYDDVDRGMIGAWFAPQYAEEMEGWIREMAGDGQGWQEGESLADVMERINEGADTPHERTARFREFLDKINVGIFENQRAQLDVVSERITRDTGIEDITTALRLPEARAQITAFYQKQLADNPGDAEAQRILTTLAEFERTEAERLKVVTARVGADLMDAREITDQLQDNLAGGLGERLMNAEIMYNSSSILIGHTPRDPELDAVQSDLASISYQARLADIRARLIASEDMPSRDVITNALTNGRDAYSETGVTQLLAESYNLMIEADDTLMAAQNKLIDEHYDNIAMHIDPQAKIERGIFRSDTTLGAELEARLRDADPENPEARELRQLLSDSNNLTNLSPDLVRRLMNNGIFLREYMRVESYRDDGVLREELHNGGFFMRGDAIYDLRKQRRDLDATAKTYGFSLAVSTPENIAPAPQPGARQPGVTDPDQQLVMR